MSKGSLGFLSAPPKAPAVAPEKVDSLYKRLRLEAFMGIFLGYAGFYLIRNNIPLVASVLKDNGIMDAVGIGIVANAVLFSYGLSKFFMAMISDRANARYFLPLGLALSAVMNLLIAFVPVLSASVAIFATVMFINGWFQGMGWPPCGRVMVHWFSTSERGVKMAIWNCAHNVGAAGGGAVVAFALDHFARSEADWTPAFWMPAIVALVVAVVAMVLIHNDPQSVGLPPVEEYRNDPDKVEGDTQELQGSWLQIVMKHVITNPVVLMLAITNVFIYTLRYGVLNWIPLYLTSELGKTTTTGGIIGFAIYELAGIVGTILCGWVSDRFFKGWRSGAGLVFLLGVGVALVIYWQLPASAPLWVFYLLIALIGGLIYGPIMLIGLQAIDLSPKYVAGTAAGFTGLFGYLLGASLASTGVGILIHLFGWDVTYICLIVVVVLAFVLQMVVGRYERAIIDKHNDKTAE